MQRILFYGFFGLAVIGVILFMNSFRSSNFLLLLGTSIVLVLPLLIYFIIGDSQMKKLDEEIERELEKLKNYGDKIEVDLNTAKILTNQWQEQIVVDNSRYAYLNNLTGNSEKNIDNIDVIHSTLLFEIPYKGEDIKLRVDVPIDEKTLEMKMAIKEKTTLYIDRNNKENLFLDLGFFYE